MKSPVPGLILAAGGIVERDGRILIVYRPRRQDWSLPKGKLDAGESPLEAACREVREETGYTVEPLALAGSTAYEVEGVPKVVLYWRMRVTGGPVPVHNPGEISEVRWAGWGEARGLLTYELEKDLLARVRR